MREMHLVMQGKGGVGKTFVSVLLSQFFRSKNRLVNCINTDPVNQSFIKFNNLYVVNVEIFDENKNIDKSKFDDLIEILDKYNAEEIVVIDNGASSFVPFRSYIKDSDILNFIKNEMNYKVIIHVPIVGGQAQQDTVDGCKEILADLNNPDLVIWANHFFGDVTYDFNEFKNDHLLGVVELKKYDQDTFGRDILKMTSEGLTFDEVIKSTNFSIMAKHRLEKFKNEVFSQLDNIFPEQPTEVLDKEEEAVEEPAVNRHSLSENDEEN
ncbi:Protein TraL [Oligella sp. MSHR50489EDL]|uniref:conjugal transfer protein TraL n=1 Tax=Oligella sp. MSHR50489EDL TaxID=3139409 RepID=UPI003D818A5E